MDDLTEWRSIEEFPMYEMNAQKQVRHIFSKRVRQAQYNGRQGGYLTFTKAGKNYSRSINAVFKRTWPELDDGSLPGPGRPKVERYIDPGTDRFRINDQRFHRIVDYPEYGINRKGEILHLTSRRIVSPAGRGELSVHLRKDGRQHYISVRTLLKRTFGDE